MLPLLICSDGIATMSSPSSNTSTNKRKADALGDSDPTGSGGGGRPAVIARLKDATSVSDPSSPTTPHIPPPIWGRVLDFMPYEEVRSALLVGKIIANEAVKYVRALHFTKGCQLDVPSARRFASVEEVNCLCLISGPVLCRDTTLRLVPLLATFAKLKRIHIGDLTPVGIRGVVNKQFSRRFYHPSSCSSPANHRELAKSFCYSFLGAFKARLLPPTLDETVGVLAPFSTLRICSKRAEDENDNEGSGMCATCRDVCLYFPLQDVIDQPYMCVGCTEDVEVYEMISNRSGAREVFREKSEDYLLTFLGRRLNSFNIFEYAEPKEEEALSRRLADLGMRCKGKEMLAWYLTMPNIEHLDRLIAVGFDPRAVSMDILKEINSGIDPDFHFNVYAKSTFDALVARGFAFDETNLLVVLDERIEPALKDIPALIRGETDDEQ